MVENRRVRTCRLSRSHELGVLLRIVISGAEIKRRALLAETLKVTGDELHLRW